MNTINTINTINILIKGNEESQEESAFECWLSEEFCLDPRFSRMVTPVLLLWQLRLRVLTLLIVVAVVLMGIE